MLVLVDVDGVVCDMFPEWVRLYNEEFNDTLNVQDFTEYDDFWTKIKPHAVGRMEEYLSHGRELYGPRTQEIEGAVDALNRLEGAGDEINFLTACHGSGHFDYKVAWLRTKRALTPDRGLIATLNAPKHLVSGGVLIDDRPETVQEFNYYGRGIGILFEQPWNRSAEGCKLRMRSWQEIGEGGMRDWLRLQLEEVRL